MAGSPKSPSWPVEPKRIRQFRKVLVRELPKFPNNPAARDALLNMPFGQLLIHYMNWLLRFIRQAVRTVTVDSAVATSVSRGQQRGLHPRRDGAEPAFSCITRRPLG